MPRRHYVRFDTIRRWRGDISYVKERSGQLVHSGFEVVTQHLTDWRLREMSGRRSNWISIASTLTVAALGFGAALSHAQTGKAPVDYSLVSVTKFGSPNFWDYLTYDPTGKRVYAAHIDKIEVMDATTGKSVGQVGPFHDAHGIAIVNDLDKGYADSGDDGVVKVFSLSDFHIIATIKVSDDADGMLYDPKTHTVLVVAGDSKNLTIIDPKDDKVVKAVTLPGKPEFFAIDTDGHAFVNIADTGSIAKVDLATGTVTATWPMAGCTNPHGLGYDSRLNRLFSGCANGVMIVVDATNGKNIASVPIGDRSDAVVVDSKRHRAISANADGTLTVVSEEAGGTYTSHAALSFFGGRNPAIDEASGTLYVAHGNMKLMSSTKDLLKLRFGWDGLNLAVLRPND